MSSSTSTSTGTTLQLKYVDASGNLQNIPFPQPVDPQGSKVKDAQKLITARSTTLARVLCQDDFRDSQTSYHNDSLGYAYRDSDVLFGPNATLRLELGGDGTTVTGIGANPGQPGPSNSGVICKRRITNNLPSGLTGKFMYEFWLRFTSGNMGGNNLPTASIYDRDGTNLYRFGFWFDCVGGTLQVLNGTSWVVLDSTLGAPYGTQHAWEPEVGVYDKAGIWFYYALQVNFGTGKYISVQMNDKVYDASAYSYNVSANTGPRALHLSHEFAFQSSSNVRRYYNVADPVFSELI